MKRILLTSLLFSCLAFAGNSNLVNASELNTIDNGVLIQEGSFQSIGTRAVSGIYVTDVSKHFTGYPPNSVYHTTSYAGHTYSGTIYRTKVVKVDGGYLALYSGQLWK